MISEFQKLLLWRQGKGQNQSCGNEFRFHVAWELKIIFISMALLLASFWNIAILCSLRSNRFCAEHLLRKLNPPRIPVSVAEELRVHRLHILFTSSSQHSVTIKILWMRVFYGMSCFITFHCWHLQGYYDTYIMKCIEKCEKKPLLIGM